MPLDLEYDSHMRYGTPSSGGFARRLVSPPRPQLRRTVCRLRSPHLVSAGILVSTEFRPA